LRSASLLEYLAGRYSADAIVFQEAGAANPLAAMPPGKIAHGTTVRLPHHSKNPAARAARNGVRLLRSRPPLLDRFAGFEKQIASAVSSTNYDLAVIEHFWCAPYVHQLRRRAKTIWLDLHNIESAWHHSLAEVSSPLHALAHRRFAQSCLQIERSLLPEFDALLVTSNQDAARVRRIAPHSNVIVYPNALPNVPLTDRHEDDAIAFSGNLEYEPNKIAVAFFNESVWPLLRDRWPNLVWRIIGKNPRGVAGLIARDPRIQLTGPVEDAIAALARAKVAVVPLSAGSGTRIKILEAWAAATPVVSTSFGAEGLDYQAGEHLLIAGSPSEFADHISALLTSTEQRIAIGNAGRRLCQDHYTWETAWRALEAAI
jgi:glycosyltransferase involved in cell wall biosynthesis